jgi:hypothetical protein
MIVDITFIVVFLGSLGAVAHIVNQKSVALATVSDATVTAYFEKRLGWALVVYRRVDHFLRDGRYKGKLLEYSCRVLHRAHILLMRLDNGVVSILRKMRTKAGTNGNGFHREEGEETSV